MNLSFKSLVNDIVRARQIGRRRRRKRSSLAGCLDQVSGLGFKPRTVIDIGVADGTFDLYKAFPEATHLLVEPLEERRRSLQEICRHYHAHYVIAAAGAAAGTTTINVHRDLVGSSVLRERDGSRVDGTPRIVPVVTIDDLCAEKRLEGPYVVKVDIQGAELTVLDGARQVLPATELVVLETSLFQFFEGGPQFYDVVGDMKNRGFVVYDVWGHLFRPFDGALAQLDVAFVKDEGRFREHHDYRPRL